MPTIRFSADARHFKTLRTVKLEGEDRPAGVRVNIHDIALQALYERGPGQACDSWDLFDMFTDLPRPNNWWNEDPLDHPFTMPMVMRANGYPCDRSVQHGSNVEGFGHNILGGDVTYPVDTGITFTRIYEKIDNTGAQVQYDEITGTIGISKILIGSPSCTGSHISIAVILVPMNYSWTGTNEVAGNQNGWIYESTVSPIFPFENSPYSFVWAEAAGPIFTTVNVADGSPAGNHDEDQVGGATYDPFRLPLKMIIAGQTNYTSFEIRQNQQAGTIDTIPGAPVEMAWLLEGGL